MSLLFEEPVWTSENRAHVYHNVIEAPLLDRERTVIEKLEDQLGHERDLVRLGAEAVVVSTSSL